MLTETKKMVQNIDLFGQSHTRRLENFNAKVIGIGIIPLNCVKNDMLCEIAKFKQWPKLP